jgi:oligosaccharide repeat unit polymerase
MIDVLFVFSYLMFPLIIYLLMKANGLSFFQLTIPSFVILWMFISAYIGTLALYFGWDNYRYASGVTDKMIMLNVYGYTTWTIFSIVAGYIFTKNIIGFGVIKSTSYKHRPLNKKEKLWLFLLLVFCFSILALYISKVPRVALIVALFDGHSEAKLARSLMGNDFAGKYYRYHLVMHHMLNFVTYVYFANWLSLNKRGAFLIFFIAFLGALFSALMATEKAPCIWLLIGLFLTYVLIRRDGKILLFTSIKLMLFLIALLTILYIFFMGSSDIGSAIASVFSRLFTGQIQPAYHYIEFFPANHGFLFGRSFPNPGGILPFEPYRITVELMNFKYPDMATLGIVGSMPTIFWGEMYANFGLIGVIVPPFIVGVALYAVSYMLGLMENTPIKIGLLVWAILHYKNLAATGLSGFIIDIYLVGILGVVFLVVVLANNGKIKYIKHIKKRSALTLSPLRQ